MAVLHLLLVRAPLADPEGQRAEQSLCESPPHPTRRSHAGQLLRLRRLPSGPDCQLNGQVPSYGHHGSPADRRWQVSPRRQILRPRVHLLPGLEDHHPPLCLPVPPLHNGGLIIELNRLPEAREPHEGARLQGVGRGRLQGPAGTLTVPLQELRDMARRGDPSNLVPLHRNPVLRPEERRRRGLLVDCGVSRVPPLPRKPAEVQQRLQRQEVNDAADDVCGQQSHRGGRPEGSGRPGGA
mmetsp:Transcript_84315/g.260751  ORF Transcript_84315/g.260751 Transcript_84315/m.260751 type:complete len:239 (+) Transcript_84315:1220-1936(+)